LFTYTQTTTVKNGTYSFEVPYSTLGPIPDETNFDTRPTGPYTITAGDVSKTVDVAEQDVLNGGMYSNIMWHGSSGVQLLVLALLKDMQHGGRRQM